VPIPAVAGQSRRLDRQYDTDPSFADRHQKTLEPRSLDPAARATEIVIDNDDLGPAERAGPIRQRVLPPPALVICSS
jgi:hypothetical protein